MQPGRRPPSTFETLLKWVLGAFFAFDPILVAPAFASGMWVDLPRGCLRIDKAALLSGGSRLTDDLGYAEGADPLKALCFSSVKEDDWPS